LPDDDAEAPSGPKIEMARDPVVARNCIYENGHGGVYIHSGARGTFEDNEILSNTYDGVRIQSGARPVFRNNRISDNKLAAVSIDPEGGGLFEGNGLRGNLEGPWKIEDGDAARIERRGNTE
jgi:parallel beta-helix repeat protein